MTTAGPDSPDPAYHPFLIESVRQDGDHFVITYAGKTFGGIVASLLPSDVVRGGLRPGARIFVRYHTPETGQPGQVAHIIMRHPCEPGWAELYADWE
jgi:hypothetical protein